MCHIEFILHFCVSFLATRLGRPFLKDADAGFQYSDPEELADNYGYDMETNRAEVRRIFKGVQGAAAKAEKLDLWHDDVIDMLNGELSDY